MDDSLVIETSGTALWVYVVIALVIAMACIALIIGVHRLLRALRRPELYGLSRADIAKRWAMIRQTSEQGLMGAKLAVMEADALLDSALKSLAMPGETLGERLKVACYKYPSLRDVWWAHKIRNQLVHESTFQLNQRLASQALDEFEKALKVLNVM